MVVVAVAMGTQKNFGFWLASTEKDEKEEEKEKEGSGDVAIIKVH